MSHYVIRLDDACPTMNHANWNRMECLLDKYSIRPIVGVIPENQDPDFAWKNDKSFWERVHFWQEKGWSIAVHGLHHRMHEHEPGKGYDRNHMENIQSLRESLMKNSLQC